MSPPFLFGTIMWWRAAGLTPWGSWRPNCIAPL